MTGAVASPGAVDLWPLELTAVSRSFAVTGRAPVRALDAVSLRVPRGTVCGLLGPDGAGKTTLLRLIAGLLTPGGGELRVLGVDVARDPGTVQSMVGYMPQRFGLYEDLTVRENLDLYADLHGVDPDVLAERLPRLLRMTALAPFMERLAGKLSGGMKQKLGLACTLVRSPELLLLDEPTVGVDPVSRRELWSILAELVQRDGLTVVVSTAYLDEAARCDHVLVLDQGRQLAEGAPAALTAAALGRTLDPGDAAPSAAPSAALFEQAYLQLLKQVTTPFARPARDLAGAEVVIDVRDLVRTFGAFVAVGGVSFQVRRGEIFGLLGPNGAGKSTTFRMLCGLLPATAGTLRVAGHDVRRASAAARGRLGYVAQKFSLYGALSARENLAFFASAYGLHGERQRARVAWATEQFDLGSHLDSPSGALPGGFKQRLAMACALMHEPELLFLDEPTSGVDPVARREFWQRITRLAEQGVTVIVTTHFMEEAEHCDRVVIMVGGKLLAEGTPAELRARARFDGVSRLRELRPAAPGTLDDATYGSNAPEQQASRSLRRPTEGGRAPTMEDAFIAVCEEAP